jgi:ferredoxin
MAVRAGQATQFIGEGHKLVRLPDELVRLDSHGFPVLLDIPVPDWLEKDAHRAVRKCPTRALGLRTVTWGPGRAWRSRARRIIQRKNND